MLVSALLKALVESSGDLTWGDPRTAELKELSGPHEIWPGELGAAINVGDKLWALWRTL